MTVILKMTVILVAVILSSCAPRVSNTSLENMITPLAPTPVPAPTSGRPAYNPGELVDYTAQSGDTIPALAARFNTTQAEIFEANPIIPRDATTMPPGLPMKIPIYYLPLWGTDFQSIPDSAFVNGPAQVGFNTSAFVASSSGWLKNYRAYAGGKNRTGAEMVDYVATNYSVSPRLLLALLEYQSGALTQPEIPLARYMLGFRRTFYDTPYLQLVIAANTLNNGYYSWRAGELTEFELLDRSLIRPDPWQNAGSVALQYYFSRIYTGDEYYASIGPDGLARVYKDLFNDPWLDAASFGIPGSLQQPELRFPFRAGNIWAYTGGPHTGWGSGEPFAAVDFAPASDTSGCYKVTGDLFATAMADGLIVRSDIDGIIIDLDKDGDERTGWVLYYLHLATGRIGVGKEVSAGDPVGYPSCEGGSSTGTHIHVARKYNGEWILADGPLRFNFEGWVAHSGGSAYNGTLTRGPLTINACVCSDAGSQVKSDVP